jgi:hypothetical protein
VLGEGWAAPLTGFMREKEFLQCQHFNCFVEGKPTNQSVPIVLPVHTGGKPKQSTCGVWLARALLCINLVLWIPVRYIFMLWYSSPLLTECTRLRIHNTSENPACFLFSADKIRMEGVASMTLRYQGKAWAILRAPEFYEHRKGSRNTQH